MRALICTLLATLLVWAPTALADPLPPQIHTSAGGGTCNDNTEAAGGAISGGTCDNIKATSAVILAAPSVAELPDGGFLYVDNRNDLVREVTASGIVQTVAGDGPGIDNAPPKDIDGVPATQSGLNDPVAVAPLPGGGFLVTEYNGQVVREVDPSGTITTVAGNGSAGFSGDGGAATSAQLNYPTEAQPLPDGSILIADKFNGRIRDVSPSGSITTAVGGGTCDDVTANCEGQGATSVALDQPDSVSPIATGGFLIAEDHGNAIREISPQGTFTTVAGTPGQAGYGGDGGSATAALLNHPQRVLSVPGGGFVIADTDNSRVREVSASGTITTVAGNGFPSDAGDGGAATDASLQDPTAMSLTPDGGFLVADNDPGLIRAVTIPPTSTIALTPATPNGKNGWYVTSVFVTVGGANAKSTNCVVDPVQAPPAFDAIPVGCPYSGSGLGFSTEGTHTIYAASVDKAGDKEIPPVSLTFRIDDTQPNLRCGAEPSYVVGTTRAILTATVSDFGSGPASPTVARVVKTTKQGLRKAMVFGRDNAGNGNSVQCKYHVLATRFKHAPRLRSGFAAGGAFTTVTKLALDRLVTHAQITVACGGLGCPFAARSVTARGHTVALQSLLAGAQLAPGTLLAVTVAKPGVGARAWLFTIRSGAPPTVSQR